MERVSTQGFALLTSLVLMSGAAVLGSSVEVARAQAVVLPCTGTETILNMSFTATRPLDDGSVEVSLDPVFTAAAPFRIAGMPFTTMFVNINGNVTFGTAFGTFTPSAVPGLSQPTLAPFFADVDLNNGLFATNPGLVRYCVEPANNRVMVTWQDTIHYDATDLTTDFTRRNTFQLILEPAVLCGTDGAVATFRHEALVWYAGTASGALDDGTCDPGDVGVTCFPAVAGVDYGDTVTAVQLPGSLTTAVTTTLLTRTNAGSPGVWRVEINPTRIPSCGNGAIDGSCEECDDGGESLTCDDDCTFVMCGDGNTNMTAGETCDDGGETTLCDDDCTEVLCGDGNTNATAGEECDDGNVTDGDGCSSTCLAEVCGNSRVDAGEDCDDGMATATCDDDCTSVSCGDGNRNALAGEDCDDGNTTDGDGCSSACALEACGNGVVDAGETCDDAGESATCDDDCTAAMCGDAVLNTTTGETCDDGGETATCNVDCSLASCGDSILNTSAGEACDDGSESATCNTDCSMASCGDSLLNTSAGETCDDGGESATCDDDCTAAMCGDSTLNSTAGEACDDGNVMDGDGCSAMCAVQMITPDAGPPLIDAGTDAGTDAGMADGGVEPMDAGPTGFGVAGGACGCRVGDADVPSQPLGLLLLGLALVMLRRRGAR